jgi:hypothetical protein
LFSLNKEVILIGQCASCKLVSLVLLGGSNPSYLKILIK